MTVTQRTEYPWNGAADFQLRADGPVDFTLALRLPGWCNDVKVKVNGQPVDLAALEEKGYAKLTRTWNSGDRIRVEMAMPVELVRSHPELREARGKWRCKEGRSCIAWKRRITAEI